MVKNRFHALVQKGKKKMGKVKDLEIKVMEQLEKALINRSN